MSLDKFLYGDSDKEKEAYQKGFMDGMRAARVEDGFYLEGCTCTEALIHYDPYHERTVCVRKNNQQSSSTN